MIMPNFFMIGAQKAGTTSLYHYLNQHPQIYMSPVKEPFFFDNEINAKHEVIARDFGGPTRRRPIRCSNIEEYSALFEGAGKEIAVGEASTLYIYAPGTAERIKRYVPDARIVAILRNPTDRAYSSFLHAVRMGVEPLTDFAAAIREEEDRLRDNWRYVFHYRNVGYYHSQLETYYKVFGRERVKVWLSEDLKENSASVVRDGFRFLGVDDSFSPNLSSNHNPSGVPRSSVARTMVRTMDATASIFLQTLTSESRIYPLASKARRLIQGRILAKPPPMDPEIRGELIEGYREDILKLQDLIGRDLSAWLKDKGEIPDKKTKEMNPRTTDLAY